MSAYKFSLTEYSGIRAESTILSLYGIIQPVKTRILAYFTQCLFHIKNTKTPRELNFVLKKTR